MSPEMISIYGLAAMFLVATILPINMGILAFAGAFLIGTLVADQTTKQIIAGFPGSLFLTLVGITYLFAIAQNNGTIDWLVRLAVKGVRGRLVAIPWIVFGISALLTSVGAVSPGAVAIIAPIALGFAAKYKISPLMMGLMVVHGAQAGGFSPISIYGGITNGVVAKAGLPLNELATFGASFGINFGVALILFFAMGGHKLFGRRAADTGVYTGHAADYADARNFGDSEAEAFSEERRTASGDGIAMGNGGAGVAALDTPDVPLERWLTVLGIILLAVLTLAYKMDIGFVAITIGLGLSLLSPNRQKRAVGQITWPEILLITGVSTYVAVLEKMGTIDWVGHGVADLTSPMMAALLLCFIGAIVSAFASSTAVLGSLIPLAVPFLQNGSGVDAVGFIAAMAVASTIVDVSPFSTNGALVLANAPPGTDKDKFFRQLMKYGAVICIVAPLVLWVLFVLI